MSSRDADLAQREKEFHDAVERGFRRRASLRLALMAVFMAVWGAVGYVAAALLSGARLP